MTQPVRFKQIEHLTLLSGQVPQVRVVRVPVHGGFTDTNDEIKCFAAVRFTLEDLPKHLLDPQYELQIELGRWTRSKRIRDRRTGQLKSRGSGFKHPSDWDGSQTLNPHGLSNRGGKHHTTVTRPAAFDLVGQTPNAAFTLNIGTIFAPWFRVTEIADFNGATVKTLRYLNGRVYAGSTLNDKGYASNAFRGFFAFRYSIYNPVTKRRESGPWSDTVCAQPARWAMKPSGLFPRDSQVNPTAGDGVLFLTASMSTTAKSSIPV